jgi:uncharacterized damage-inducible protein DinB
MQERTGHETPVTPAVRVLTPEELREHWQGHRRLTRRVIEAFPEKELFAFSLGGLRPFAAIVGELLAMAAPMARGVATDEWPQYAPVEHGTKAALLAAWDEQTERIDEYWARIPPGRFQERMNAFGQYEGPVHGLLFYAIDNEIHHRGQGYVYLRALGVEPPPFWERD